MLNWALLGKIVAVLPQSLQKSAFQNNYGNNGSDEKSGEISIEGCFTQGSFLVLQKSCEAETLPSLTPCSVNTKFCFRD